MFVNEDRYHRLAYKIEGWNLFVGNGPTILF